MKCLREYHLPLITAMVDVEGDQEKYHFYWEGHSSGQ